MNNLLSAFRSPKISSDFSKYSAALFLISTLVRRNSYLSHGFNLHDNIDKTYSSLDITEQGKTLLALRYAANHVTELNEFITKAYVKMKPVNISKNWEMLLEANNFGNSYGYYGQVWINHTSKEILFVSTGTKSDFHQMRDSKFMNLYGLVQFVKDIINDVQIFMQSTPYQYKYGLERLIHLFLQMDLDISNYDVIFTGHSLGGLVSDIGALYFHKFSHLCKSIHSITLENPGSKPSIETLHHKMIELGHLPKNFILSEAQKKFIVINNQPNWINTACEQFGCVYLNKREHTQTTDIPMAKFIPSEIKNFIITALNHFEMHDKKYFKLIQNVAHSPEWPVGLFSNYINDKSSQAANIISEFICRFSVLQEGLYKIIPRITNTEETEQNPGDERDFAYEEYDSDYDIFTMPLDASSNKFCLNL